MRAVRVECASLCGVVRDGIATAVVDVLVASSCLSPAELHFLVEFHP